MSMHALLPLDDQSTRPGHRGARLGRLGHQLVGSLAGILMLAALAACGGGGSEAPIGGNPPDATASGFTQGAINGFGSIVVNGVRFDDSSAQVADDRGGLHDSGALKLGMQVEIEHGTVDATAASAKAHVIRFGEWVRGPVESVNAAAGSLTVLGQNVLIRSTTVFDGSISGGLAGVHAGDVVEIHGLFDAAQNAVLASRIELTGNATSYKLRGSVAALNTFSRTFNIGAATISYGNLPVAGLPTGLANGMVVRVVLATAKSNGQWVATELKGGPTRPVDWAHAEVRGIVTAFTSSTQFSVNGLPVDASGAGFPDGTSGIRLGALVEVEGAIRSGVMIATKVELEERHSGDDNRHFSLNGDISALNTTDKTMMVKSTLVRYGSAVLYINGNESKLANGQRVHVMGLLAADRQAVQALSIRFDK